METLKKEIVDLKEQISKLEEQQKVYKDTVEKLQDKNKNLSEINQAYFNKIIATESAKVVEDKPEEKKQEYKTPESLIDSFLGKENK